MNTDAEARRNQPGGRIAGRVTSNTLTATRAERTSSHSTKAVLLSLLLLRPRMSSGMSVTLPAAGMHMP